MINLRSEGNLTLKPFQEIQLNDFSVIVGINGAGKTQLLKAIESGIATVSGVDRDQIQYFNYNEFQLKQRSNIEKSPQPQPRTNTDSTGQYSVRKEKERIKNNLIQKFPLPDEYQWLSDILLYYFEKDGQWTEKENKYYFKFLRNLPDDYQIQFPGTLPISQSLNIALELYTMMGKHVNTFNYDTCKHILDQKIIELEENYPALKTDITLQIEKKFAVDNIFYIPTFLNSFDLLIDNICEAETQYQKKKELDDFQNYKFLKAGKETDSIAEEINHEYYKKSPVEEINEVLEEYNINGYSFSATSIQIQPGISAENQRAQIFPSNKNRKFKTQFESLSTGEKILIALAFLDYQSRFNKNTKTRLLLLDEIDSFLHPEMIKRFTRVLKKSFVKKGISVIMSTHSPTTVALSDPDSVFLMEEGMLRKSEQSVAINFLTVGVPTLSIDFENRKQVFVESPNDAFAYETLYSSLRDNLNQSISLHFISSGSKRNSGSKFDVGHFVNALVSNGNKKIYGIIDWDTTSTSTNDHLKVIGENMRYTIENYLLDPLYIALILIESGEWSRVSDTKYKLPEVVVESQEILNNLSNIVQNYLIQRIKDVTFFDNCKNVKVDFSDNSIHENIESELVCGFKINTQKLFCYKINGHCYEGILLRILPCLNAPSLNQKFKKYGLKGRVLQLLNNYPYLIFSDYKKLFENIQNHR